MFKIFKKIFKSLKKTFKKIGKKLKKGFGKVAKAFGKLGPLGTFALNWIVGVATAGAGSLFMKGLTTALGKMGTVGKFILNVGSKIKQAASFVKKGVGTVFNKISDGIEFGMNRVSQPFMKEGAKGLGSAFRDFVSKASDGFITPSKQGAAAGTDLIPGVTPVTQEPFVGPLQDGVVVPARDPYSPDAMLEAMGVQVEPNPQDLVDAAIAEQGSFGVRPPDGAPSLLSPTEAVKDVVDVDPLSSEGILESITASADAAAANVEVTIAPPALPAEDTNIFTEATATAAAGAEVLAPINEQIAKEERWKANMEQKKKDRIAANRALNKARAQGMLSDIAADPLYHSPGIQYYNIADPMQSGIDPSQYDYGTNAYYGAFQTQANA